jgi:hypothetical protein
MISYFVRCAAYLGCLESIVTEFESGEVPSLRVSWVLVCHNIHRTNILVMK